MKYRLNVKKYPIYGDMFEELICYNEALEDFKLQIERLIKSINNLPTLDDRFLSTGLLEPITAEYMHKVSRLWNGEWKSVSVNSDIFIYRYITLLLGNIRDNVDIMTDNYLKSNGMKVNYRSKAQMLSQILGCIADMINSVEKKKDFSKQFQKLSELIGSNKKKDVKNWQKVYRVVQRESSRLEEMNKKMGFLSGAKVEDEIILQNIFLLAYVISTGEHDVSHTFMIPEGTTMKDKDVIHAMIEELGCCILETRAGDFSEMSFIYTSFISALPSIQYQWSDINYNVCLREGCRALAFLDFYLNSKFIHRVLKKVIY